MGVICSGLRLTLVHVALIKMDLEDKDAEDEDTPCPSPREMHVGVELIQMGAPSSPEYDFSAEKQQQVVVVEEGNGLCGWRCAIGASCCLVVVFIVVFLDPLLSLFRSADGNVAVTTPSSAPIAVTVQTVTHQAGR